MQNASESEIVDAAFDMHIANLARLGKKMGKPTGFIEFERQTNPMRPEEERLKDWKRFMFYEMRKLVKHKVLDVWIAEYHFVIAAK